MPGTPIRIETGRRGASELVRTSSDMAARIEDAALEGRGVRAGEGAGLSVQDSMPPKVQSEMLAGLVPVSPASDIPSPQGGGLGRGDIPPASAFHDSFTLADSLAMASPPVRPGLFARGTKDKDAPAPAEAPPENPIMPPIMPASEVPDDVARRLSWVLVRSRGRFKIGEPKRPKADKKTKKVLLEFLSKGRRALEGGDVWLIARQMNVYLFQDRDGNVKAVNAVFMEPGGETVFLSEGILLRVENGSIQRIGIERLAEDDKYLIIRFSHEDSFVTRAIDKSDESTAHIFGVYTSPPAGSAGAFTYNQYGDVEFEPAGTPLAGYSRLPDAVIEVAVGNISANGGGGFGKYSPALWGGHHGIKGVKQKYLAKLRTSNVKIIGIEKRDDESFFLLQDRFGGVLAVGDSKKGTMVVDGVHFEKMGLYYSAVEGLAAEIARDDRFILFIFYKLIGEEKKRESGFLLDRRTGDVVRYTERYFGKEDLFMDQEGKVFRGVVIDFKGDKPPRAGSILLRREGERFFPIRDHRDYRLWFMTDMSGVIRRLEGVQVVGTDLYVVTSPEMIERADHWYDGTGTSKNVWVVERTKDGMREVTGSELPGACTMCEKKYVPRRSKVWRFGALDRVKFKVPNGTVNMFEQVVGIGEQLVTVYIEASSKKKFNAIFSDIRRYLELVPVSVWTGSKKISFYQESADFYGLDHKDVRGSYSAAGGISVFGIGRWSGEETTYHEAGHALIGMAQSGGHASIDMSHSSNGRAIEIDALLAIASSGPWAERYYKEKFGGYFALSWAERMCEALALFLPSPEEFRAVDGPVARFWDGLLNMFEKE